MAGYVTESSTSILAKLGTSIAGAGASWLFTKGLNALEGGSETDQIKKDINQVLEDVEMISNAVQSLSKTLLADIVTLRGDELQQPVDAINALYADIGQIIDTVLALPTTLSAADRAAKVQDAQTRLDSRLTDCANDVPKYLTQINSFLTETTSGDQVGYPFLQQVAQKCLDESTDFLGYYGKTKAIIIGYWVVIAKGIALLQMAFWSPGVDFVEGADAIQAQKNNLSQQDQVFRTTIGQNTINLAELVINAEQPSYTAISFSSNAGYRVALWPQFNEQIFIGCPGTPTSPDGTAVGPTLWWLESGDALFAYEPNGSYALRVSEDATEMRLVMSGSQWEAVEVPDDDKNDANVWFIKPITPGSDRYSLQFQSRYQGYSNFLVANTVQLNGDSALTTVEEGDVQLRWAETFDPDSTAFRWQISGWVDPPST
ncbi:hypothetical protein FPANT_3310 [Fusarium pseudoanthophilum]|uniref:Uncharacterized protein n=1 Tax=Fusarium pseudoanthophilum TaxID=48495 RepID=A0A8H5PN96_9HYPO|nr:hypothetical protein FPANT_3310 [Fusarium pseudoanthophilum]